MTSMAPLGSFASDVHSQNGEDGIISELLDRIEAIRPLTRWCAEFGAHDGETYSNTCNLIRNRGFRAVMIEGDPARSRHLAENHPQPEVIKISAMVGLDGEQRIDRILAATGIPADFDLLSIDIDGGDYWILDSIEQHHPAIIVIEFNPSIPNAVEFVQERDLAVGHGSSPRSIQTLAESKGYELVAVTFTNLILVRRDLRGAVLGEEAPPVTLEQLRDDSEWITHVFAGYDGTLLFSRPEIRLPWHFAKVDVRRLQPVRRFWRSFPDAWPDRGLRAQSWRVLRRLSRRLSYLSWSEFWFPAGEDERSS